jgi:regulator of nucleoside diphosphate kinase
VTYVEQPSGVSRTLTLAYPADADLASRKLSVLSPIGRALIGRKRGDSLDVALPEGRSLVIRIVATTHRKPLKEAA